MSAGARLRAAVIRALPDPARKTIRALLRRPPRAPAATARAWISPSPLDPPQRFTLPVPPPPVADQWPEPPEIEKPDATTGRAGPPADPPQPFDIDLLESLNAEYASHPFHQPPAQDAGSRAERARKRLVEAHRLIDLSERRVLEIGCGAGYEVWYIAHQLNSDAYGLDIAARAAWEHLSGPSVHFACADIAAGHPFDDNQFDRIISFSVWEHITHPYAALEQTFRILKPGGLAYISANLHRSAIASHRSREITFPWPHLLFSDDVVREFFRRRGRNATSAWVNRLSWADYERHMRRIGFQIRMLRFSERPIDEAFYERFEAVLGRYPRTDLTHDFFKVVLEKAGAV
ncbi:MAG: methyltransferase domain-containing protein [Candidatus Limnocylindrales bacterium]